MKNKVLVLFTCLVSQQMHAQNVGIGTLTPVEKLHVAGNIKTDTVKPNAIKLTPNAGAGKLLTSDATGNASWQNGNAAPGSVGFGTWGDCSSNNISEYNPVADVNGLDGDHFGQAVAISGSFAIIGAYQSAVGTNNFQGSASIYQYDGTNWVFMQKLTDATGAANDYFGYAVSISGNYAVVGAYVDDVGANINQGSASIYQYNGSSWVLMQKITDATGAANDYYGFAVAISGNYVIIGSLLDDIGANSDQGSAIIYQYNGSSWVLMQKITDASGIAGDQFGNSVSISGTRAVVGAAEDDVGGNNSQGSASIYQYSGSNWTLMQKLTDANGAAGDLFGTSVSISGANLIIGAIYSDASGAFNAGAASIYEFARGVWGLRQKLIDPASTPNTFFGCSVSISGNYALIGAYFTNTGPVTDIGHCILYIRVGSGWQKHQYITDPGGSSGDFMGTATGIDGATKQFVIGSPGFINQTGKAIFGKIN